MNDSRFVEWGFLLVTSSNVLLIVLVLTLLWQRLFPSANAEIEETLADAPEDASDTLAHSAANLISDAQQQDVALIGQAMTDSLDLVGQLDDVDGAAYPAWKKTNQPYIDELLTHREALEFKLDDLKSKLDRAHKLVTNLHAQNRDMRGAEAQLQRLQLEHDRQEGHLIEARRERDSLTLTVQHLREELTQAQQVQTPAVEEPAPVDLQARQELLTLRETLEEERAKLSRTLVEKEFIEQVFIDTDAVTDNYQTLQRDHAALQEELKRLQAQLQPNQSM